MIEDEEVLNDIVRYLDKIAKEITGQQDTSFCFIMAYPIDNQGTVVMNTLANIDEANSLQILKEFANRLEENMQKQGTPDIETQH